ncbi:RNA polymerase sigma factor [Litoreibacter sp.]|nr:RNA polymerase sigma factor [Litoreibacter sp.]
MLTRKPFETSAKVYVMMVQMNGQARCIPVPIIALMGCSTGILNASVREGGVSIDLKKDLIALLPRLRRFARSLTRSVVEADDLVQEACLRALTRSDQWDPSQPLDRWMFRITRNLWISEIRKRTVRVGQGTVPADETHELLTTETGEETVVATQLQRQIAALPQDLSAVLLTVSVEGYSYAEAAELFDIPVGTVMSRVHRARKALAKQMAEPQGACE